MPEPVAVDTATLWPLVERLTRTADELAAIPIPGLEALPGSALGGLDTPQRVTAEVRRLATAVQDWVCSARRVGRRTGHRRRHRRRATPAAVTHLDVAQVLTWRPEALTELADEWDGAAGRLQAKADAVDDAMAGTSGVLTGSAAGAARHAIGPTAAGLRRMCRALILAAAEARDAADVIGRGRDRVLAVLADARGEGCPVADDGTVGPPSEPSALLVVCSGGSDSAASAMLDERAAELTRVLQGALSALGAADAEAARAIDAVFDAASARPRGGPAGRGDRRSGRRLAADEPGQHRRPDRGDVRSRTAAADRTKAPRGG